MKRIYIIILLNLLFGFALAHGQLLVQNGNYVSAYNFNGTLIQSNFISFSGSTLQGVTVDGTNIYVADYSGNAVYKFGLNGGAFNPSKRLFPVSQPEGIAIDGTNVYVARYGNSNSGGVGKYSTSGKIINASLITSIPFCVGVAACGTNLYVSGGTPGGVYKFGLDGTQATNFSISALGVHNIAINGTNLYVGSDNGIGEYTLDGVAINQSFISGSGNGILIFNNVIYVSSDAGKIRTYNMDGTPITTNSIGSNGSYFGLAVMPPLVIGHAISSPTNFGFNINAISNQAVAIEICTNLSSPNWMPLQTNLAGSNNWYFADSTWTNDSQRFYRVVAQ